MRDEANLPRRTRWTWLAALPLLLGAQRVAAQECQADADCGAGYRCAVSTALLCTGCGPTSPPEAGVPWDAGTVPSAPDAVARPESDAGAAFPGDVDGGGECPESTCTTVEYHYCEPAPCTSDADCGSSMACYTQTWQECSGDGSCKPGYDCEEDAGFSCTEHSASSCTERYNMPCRADTDCGEGFECNRGPYTTCAGGGSVTPDGDGGFVYVDAGSSCTSELSETGYCNLLPLPCAADVECPTGMTCQTAYTWPPCFPWPQDASVTPVVDASLPGDKGDAGTGVPFECPPPEQTQACRPESWGGGGTIGGSDGGSEDAGTGTPSSYAGPPSSGGAPGGGTGGGGLFGGGLGGTGGGGGSGTVGDDAGAGPGSDDEDDESEEGHGHGHGHHGGLGTLVKRLLGNGGGCSVAGEADGNFAWFALLGPANMPPAITARLSQEAAAAMSAPDVKQALLKQGMESIGTSSDELKSFLATDIARWKKVAAESNTRLD